MPTPEAISDLLRSWGRGESPARDSLFPRSIVNCDGEPRRTFAANGRTTRCSPPRWSRSVPPAGRRTASPGKAAPNLRRRRANERRTWSTTRVSISRQNGPARHSGWRWTIGSVHLAFDCEVCSSKTRCRNWRFWILVRDRLLIPLLRRDVRRGVAEVLCISRSTVTREWQTARAWLYQRITKLPKRRAQ